MEFDLLVRWAVAGSILLGIGTFVLGGLLTPVAGVWGDGDRRIELTQFGPRVRGSCERPGGSESYSGFALFGYLWLSRRDRGQTYLISMGFPAKGVHNVAGMVTARLSLRLRSGALAGTFRGMRFRFNGEKVASATLTAPAERLWERLGGY